MNWTSTPRSYIDSYVSNQQYFTYVFPFGNTGIASKVVVHDLLHLQWNNNHFILSTVLAVLL